MHTKVEIGERIAIERKRLGKTQADFATQCGVSTNSQINYEKGLRAPDVDYLVSFQRAGGDLSYIINGTRALIASDGRAVYESNREDGFQTAGQLLAAEIAVMELADDDAEALLHIARKLSD
jgi:transcriptional regulator with XRE-family HTH domain